MYDIFYKCYILYIYLYIHLIFITILWRKYYYYYFQRRKPKYREIGHLPQGHPLRKWKNHTLIPGTQPWIGTSSLLCSKHKYTDCISQECMKPGSKWIQPKGSCDKRTKRGRSEHLSVPVVAFSSLWYHVSNSRCNRLSLAPSSQPLIHSLAPIGLLQLPMFLQT